jgi:hypothetical protein
MMKQSKKLLLLAVLGALVIPVLFAGTATAKYVGDAAVQSATSGGWVLPADKGFCVTGIKRDGTMLVDLSVGNSRPDCIAKIFPAYTTSAACLLADKAGANAEGSHFWTSTCISGTDNTKSISLSGLDRTRFMCEQLGGTWRQACTGSWTAMGPTWSAAPVASGQGGTDGFCYTTIRLDNYDNTTCPKVVAGSPGTGTFGYAWNTTTNACTYAYGIIGRANANINYKDNTATTGTYAAAGSLVNLSGLTNGQCLANGASFSNHTVKGGNVIEADSLASTIARPITQVRAGCLSCHNTTTQYNSVAGRWKSDYLKQGHRNMLRKVTAPKPWGGPNSLGEFQIYTDWFLEAPEYTEESSGNVVDKTLSLGTFNWTAGTVTVTPGNVDGLPAGTYPLMYIAGGMNEVLETIHWDNATKTAILNINEGAYGCAACHVTGFRNDNASIGVCTKSRYNNNKTNC